MDDIQGLYEASQEKLITANKQLAALREAGFKVVGCYGQYCKGKRSIKDFENRLNDLKVALAGTTTLGIN